MEEKTLLRSVMRLLHPDLFSAFPVEQEINANALKKLNHYLDELAQNSVPAPISLHFWIKKDEGLKEIKTNLKSDGMLIPLYYALDLITNEEFTEWAAESPDHRMDEDLLDWLKSYVGKVVEDGEQHSILRSRLMHMKADIESKHHLKNLFVGDEFGMGVSDLKLQVDLLKILDTGMCELDAEIPNLFDGLSICLHQPGKTPLNPFSQTESSKLEPVSWVSDEGCLHLVVQQDKVVNALKSLDLDRAELLTRLHSFWERRAAELRDSVKKLFRVEDVLCDVSTGSSAQQFVLWAGCIMTNRSEIVQRLTGMQLPLTLLVHSDHTTSMVDYSTASTTLHVRTDCSPMHLVEFVQSDRCLSAGDKAKEMLTDDIEEQRILEAARKALGAKHVIRICSVYERQQAIRAAERLIENADSIRQTVDLTDAGIAIDSNYHAWESGFISIPYDYRMTELRPNLRKLIGTSKGNSKGRSVRKTRRSNIPTTSCINRQLSVKHIPTRVPRTSYLCHSFHSRPLRFV